MKVWRLDATSRGCAFIRWPRHLMRRIDIQLVVIERSPVEIARVLKIGRAPVILSPQ